MKPAPAVFRNTLARLSLFALALPLASPAHAAFHLNEITKVMAGFEGDATVQAIELKMLANGENLVSGRAFQVYNGMGALQGSLGAFAANLPASGAVTGRRILVATSAWVTRFGLTPDLVISAGIPVTSGQVAFEDPAVTCRIDAIAYGNVTTSLVGTSSAAPLPNAGATALVRNTDNPTIPSCPMATNSGTQFTLTSGTSAAPITFTNNAGASVNVFSTATSVDPTPGVPTLRIAPNPVRESARIESPGGESVRVYDLRGRLVRTVLGPHSGPVHATWNGTDDRGQPLPSGVYFIRQGSAGAPTVRRFVIAR